MKSHQGQSCVKSFNITPSSSSKLHPNPSVLIQPHTKKLQKMLLKLHTKPRSISNSPRKMMKKNVGRKKKNFVLIFLNTIFHFFWRGGLCPPPGGGASPRVYTSPPVGRPSSLARICFVRRSRTTVRAMHCYRPLDSDHHLNFKNSTEIEIQEIFNFFRLKPAPGHGLS